MSINYCTIGNSTIDTFCGSRRAIVLNRLIKELHPAVTYGGGKGEHLKYVPSTLQASLAARERNNEQSIPSTELDKIVVTVEFNGITKTVAQSVLDQSFDLVYVTDLEVTAHDVSVNISDVKFEI